MATLSFRYLGHRIREALANRRLRRELATAPAYGIAELPEDTLGRIRGIARPLDQRVLEAPLTGRLCVYYAITIDGLRAKQYKLLDNYDEAIAFVLEDGPAHAVIDPIAARVSCEFDQAVRVTTGQSPTDRARDILTTRGILDRNLRFFSELRIREAIVEVDDAITVLGAGTREPVQASETYRDGTATRLRMVGSPRFPLVISD